MKSIKCVLLSFVVLASFSCSVVEEGNSDTDDTSITFEDHFPNSVIDVNAYLLGGSSRTWSTLGFTIDGVNGFQNCRLDDEIQLNADQTYDYNGGDMLCGAEDNQKLKSGNWEVDTEARTLTFDKGTDQEGVFFIESFSSKMNTRRNWFNKIIPGFWI